jgi:hypothetical protein
MKKIINIAVCLTGFFLIIFISFSVPQAGLIEPTRSLKSSAEGPAQLTVFSEPPGLSIKLDGKLVGQTPMRMDAVEPGTHQLYVGESVTEIYVAPGQPFHISLFKNKFIQFDAAKKETATAPGAGKTSTSETPAPQPSPDYLRTKEENRKAWERWMQFVDGSLKHF